MRHMRRGDREVTEFDDILAIIEKCDVCRLALNDADYPYILPLNFGMALTEARVIELYFHGASEGTKLDLIAKDNRASFEMDCGHILVTDEEHGSCTMAYESVIGRGRITLIPDEGKADALRILMRHYHREDFPFSAAAIPRTTVFKLTVESVTGKVRRRPVDKSGA